MDVMRRTQVSKADSGFLQALPILAKIVIRKFYHSLIRISPSPCLSFDKKIVAGRRQCHHLSEFADFRNQLHGR